MNEKFCILIQLSLNVVQKGLIDNKSTLFASGQDALLVMKRIIDIRVYRILIHKFGQGMKCAMIVRNDKDGCCQAREHFIDIEQLN